MKNTQPFPRLNFRKVNQFFILSILLAGLLYPAAAPLRVLAQNATCAEVTIHYHRRSADYDGWGLHVWGPTTETDVVWENPLTPTGQDEFGPVWVVGMETDAEFLNYIVHKGDEKDPGPDQQVIFSEAVCEFWLVQGRETQFATAAEALAVLDVQLAPAPRPDADQVLLHYRRSAEDYDGWGLHVWGPTVEQGVTWTAPLNPDGQDDYGIYWLVEMESGAEILNYIVHKGDEKDPGPDQSLDITGTGQETWLIEGSGEQFLDQESAKEALLAAGVGDIKNKAQAHWITRDTIAWPVDFGSKAIFQLHYDPTGSIHVTQDGLQGGQVVRLEFAGENLNPALAELFPHLKSAVMLKLPVELLSQVPELLKGQTAVSVLAPDGKVLGATALQIPGVLDDLYANDQTLGVDIAAGVPVLRLWAPTAKNVTLRLFDDAKPDTPSRAIPMSLDPQTGNWTARGDAGWLGKYYLYEVQVFVRQEGRIVDNLVTDPYSISLSMNSTRSQIVDLNAPALIPDGWETLDKPLLEAPEDIVLYELHIRDFSAFDESVPIEQRGTYKAFTQTSSNGMRHLRRLADAGLTHIHLLPAFDIATINEDKSTWITPDYNQHANLPPNSDQQQALLTSARGQDGYNWGYDPFHYTTPEGSYSTNPEGTQRILEFREMVQALNQTGLRVVMDVVYNHTNASGQSEKSVLDKIVPGYYHRLDANGVVTSSTCCANTASEHAMMEKLMLDSLRTWATAYKVDGFRFDLMGHHMLANMDHVRQMLDSLSMKRDGVDGASIYIYGEGWDYGEVAGNNRGVNATQANLAGSGIGTFNDRIRDAVRGGNPFNGIQEQGFITGLYTDPNESDNLPEKSRLAKLLELSDLIRLSLAGNLADYELVNAEGLRVSGAQVGYNGIPAGYTFDPQENIQYISSHDNETLFDAIQYKAPLNTSLEERVRMQNLGLSIVALGQGIPFFHAGSELLRSKSLDRDSYDSGDWFNRLDYTYQTNNWGVGLPPADKNSANYPIMTDLLSRPELKPTPAHIEATLNHFTEMLAIRHSSALFRLRTAQEIKDRVLFYNTGPEQIPGLIVMAISDHGWRDLDPNAELIVVLMNANPEPVSFTLAELEEPQLALHPIQANSADPIVRTAAFAAETQTFTIPGRTTAVFTGWGRLADAPAPSGGGGLGNMLPWLFVLFGSLVLIAAAWMQIRLGISVDLPHV